ncbi:MAG: hypothetical protein QG655_3089 [Actinomycetota bacterium]|jgi:hypothetical protein|nr:hypothetical protein [Actinomycetota bacterium]
MNQWTQLTLTCRASTLYVFTASTEGPELVTLNRPHSGGGARPDHFLMVGTVGR